MTVKMGYAQSMLGQWVDVHSAYGVHSGILHQVRPDGIVLAMPRATAVSYRLANQENTPVEPVIIEAIANDIVINTFRPRIRTCPSVIKSSTAKSLRIFLRDFSFML